MDVKTKIAALLALAKGGVPGESENAAAAAARLCAKYRIEAATISDIDGGDVQYRCVHKTNRYVRWRSVLAKAVARANGCEYLLGNGHDLVMVGLPKDLDTANYLLHLLFWQVDKELSIARQGQIQGRKACGDFRLGCAARIAERVKEATAQAEQEAGGQALARLDALSLRVKDALPPLQRKRVSKMYVQKEAYLAGRRAGNRVSLDGGSVAGELKA